MSVLLIIVACAGWVAVTILRAIAADEVRGHIARRISASVEATIASLPPELRDEWADEWRAEIAATITMPVTAALLARGLRHSASQLISDAAVAPTSAHHQQHRSALRHASGRILPAALEMLNSWSRPREQGAALVDGLARGIIVIFTVALVGVPGIAIGASGGVVGVIATCVLTVGGSIVLVGVAGVDVLLVLVLGVLSGGGVVAAGGSAAVGVLTAVLFVVVVVALGVVVEDKAYGPQATPARRLHVVLEGHDGELVLTAEQAREVDAMLKSWGEPPASDHLNSGDRRPSTPQVTDSGPP
jgi:hypothetical protein